MAYLVGAANADRINVGALTTWTTKISVAVRLKMTQAVATDRTLFRGNNATTFIPQLNLEMHDAGTNRVRVSYIDSAAGAPLAFWVTGFTAGSIHWLFAVIDTTLGSDNVKLYADTDATPKATGNGTNGPEALGGATTAWNIGAQPSNSAESAAATIYEVGMWRGVALTGAECAAIAAGTPPATPPDHYWGLISDANDLFGGAHGTVTGACVVAHSGTNLYSPAPGRLPPADHAPARR